MKKSSLSELLVRIKQRYNPYDCLVTIGTFRNTKYEAEFLDE
jgi:hypothetical protein